MYEWEGVAGQPAKKVTEITWDYLAEFDQNQTQHAIDYIKRTPRMTSPSSWT